MTKRAKLLLAATTLSVLALTGCGQDRPRITPLPPELTECADEPDAPALSAQDWSSVEAAMAAQKVRDDVTLEYLLTLRSAFGDCKAKVAGAKAWNGRITQ